MEKQKLPQFPPVMFTALLLMSLGWIGLAVVVLFAVPEIGPRWLLFFTLTIATSGTALPIVYFLNKRFPNKPPADTGTLIRQALLVGAYFDMLAWLRWGRALTMPLALLLAAGLILFEYLLRLRSGSRFRPDESKNDPTA